MLWFLVVVLGLALLVSLFYSTDSMAVRAFNVFVTTRAAVSVAIVFALLVVYRGWP